MKDVFLKPCVFGLDQHVIVDNIKMSKLASESDGCGILPEGEKTHKYFQIRRPNL